MITNRQRQLFGQCKYLLLPLVFITQLSWADIAASRSPVNLANPQANPNAIVQEGKARFTVLTPQLIRLEYSPSEQFENRASFAIINRDLPTPAFKKSHQGNKLIIATRDLELVYTPDGKPFNSTNLAIKVNDQKKSLATWKPGQVDSQNLRGTTRTLDQNKGWAFADKLENGVISKSGWALIDDSQNLLFDGNPEWNWVAERPKETDYQDWYFFGHGHNFKQALFDFTQVSGKIPLPPKYAFGYWWSRYWIYNDNELRQLVSTIRSENIPMDVLIIDMDWHETYNFNGLNPVKDEQGEMRGWTGYTWNKQLFPEPKKFIEWTNKAQLKTALNLHPASGVPTMEEKYAEFAKAIDDHSGKYLPYDLSNKKWAQTYFDTLLKPMQEWGIDFWWLDWQQFLQDKRIPSLSNTWWLNYTFFTDMEKTGKRPMIFHRWGGLGNHRYPIGFSGDAFSTWDTLDFETYFTATAANQGYAYWSHDIGGHISDDLPTDGEMYLRWIQFGTFSPILRTHSSKVAHIERRPWMFPNQFFAMRDAIQLRYRLAPYIYAAARKTYDTGLAFVRPLYYEYPQAAAAYEFKTEYFFGDDLLVAPITTPIDKQSLLAQKSLWIPPGTWFDVSRGQLQQGQKTLQLGYAQDEIPVFAKAGAIIHENPVVTNLQTTPEKQILRFIPGATSGTTTTYNDDSESTAYQTGAFISQKISQRWISTNQLEIDIDAAQGQLAANSTTQTWDLIFPNRILPSSISINGNADSPVSEFDANELSLKIHLPKLSTQTNQRILINFALSAAEQDKLFDGSLGFLRRMVKATEILKYATVKKDWGGTLPNPVYEASNITNRLQYSPENAPQILKEIHLIKTHLAQDIHNIQTVDEATKQQAINYIEISNK